MAPAGKHVVITGATSGIGLAAARLFCRRGASVYICGRSGEKLRRALEVLRREGEATDFLCDMADSGPADRFAREVAAKSGGQVDVWVNNAGGMHHGLLAEESLENFHRILAQNVNSVLLGCQKAAALIESDGVIINAASYSGGKPSVRQGSYSPARRQWTASRPRWLPNWHCGVFGWRPIPPAASTRK